MVPRGYTSFKSFVSDDFELEELRTKIGDLEGEEMHLDALLSEIDKVFAKRRAPFVEEKEKVMYEKSQVIKELARRMTPLSPYPPAPGPIDFAFVDRRWFTIASNLVVVANLSCMALEFTFPTYRPFLYVCEQLFLVLYVFELVAKWNYHRRNLFFGNIFVVWWNWLDASIVVCGIIDQWLMLLVEDFIPFRIPQPFSTFLKMLRLFRVFRFLKVLKPLIQGDLSWTEEAPFQLFMSAVITVNSVVMALELDYDWACWFWFEQAFLVIYFFEISVRLKEFGCVFFTNKDSIWNSLDFIMVCGGAFNLWLMPAWSLIQTLLYGKADDGNPAISSILKILRMAKILRVLRLSRLLRMVKPLYSLLIGVMEALNAMKWVMILTLLILYGGAIVFTSLIGHGYIYSTLSDVPPEAEMYFGTVPQSVFSLFKLMNGDISVVEPITQDIKGRLLFICFMILSNWAVLAILTSVVSDHMISASQRLHEAERREEFDQAFYARKRLLTQFFADVDDNNDGMISESEWHRMLNNPEPRQHLRDLTGLDESTLREIFYCIAEERKCWDGSPKSRNDRNASEPFLRCNDFIEHLEHDKDSVDRRQMLHLRYWLEKVMLARIQDLQSNLHDEFNELRNTVDKAMRLSNDGESLPIPRYHQEATPIPNLADARDNSRAMRSLTKDGQGNSRKNGLKL